MRRQPPRLAALLQQCFNDAAGIVEVRVARPRGQPFKVIAYDLVHWP